MVERGQDSQRLRVVNMPTGLFSPKLELGLRDGLPAVNALSGQSQSPDRSEIARASTGGRVVPEAETPETAQVPGPRNAFRAQHPNQSPI